MSWDVLIIRLNNPPPEGSNLPDVFDPLPLGSGEDLKSDISKLFPGIDWSHPSLGSLQNPDFTIEFSFPRECDVNNLMLHIFGSGNPLPIICRLCTEFGWYAYDTTLSTFMDVNNPSEQGWEEYMNYRNQIFRHLNEK